MGSIPITRSILPPPTRQIQTDMIMDLTEAYLYLFTDSIMSSLVVIPNNALVYDLLRYFGGYNSLYMMALAILGGIIGSMLNFGLGYLFRSFKVSTPHQRNSASLLQIEKYFISYGKYLLIFSYLPFFGGLLTTFAGLTMINFRFFIILVTISKCGYYIFFHHP